MLSTEGRLYVPGATAEQWTKRYGIEPFTHPCGDCGRPLTTTVPFVKGPFRGLEAPPCVCGRTQTPYCYVSAPGQPDTLACLLKLSERPRKKRRSRRNRPPPSP